MRAEDESSNNLRALEGKRQRFWIFYYVSMSTKSKTDHREPPIESFSNDNATRKEDGISRGMVWTRLPVSLLTSWGQVHVTFTTAFSVFSRREDNAVLFACISVGKGKEHFFPNTRNHFLDILPVF